jgi:hypothetical protein
MEGLARCLHSSGSSMLIIIDSHRSALRYFDPGKARQVLMWVAPSLVAQLQIFFARKL